MEKFTLINQERSRIKVFEPFEDISKPSSSIYAMMISYGCVYKRSSKPVMKGSRVETIEALWSGLPVITLQGKNFASRVSASILRSIGLEELIAKTINEYKEKVIFYSKNPNEINILKNKLSKLKSNGELFNTETFTKKLENVLKDLKR